MSSRRTADAALSVESMDLSRGKGSALHLVLRNSGSKTIDDGTLYLRLYTSDLVILGEKRTATQYALSPGEKERIICLYSDSDTEKVHVRSFTEADSDLTIEIDEWFAVADGGEENDVSVKFERIAAPI